MALAMSVKNFGLPTMVVGGRQRPWVRVLDVVNRNRPAQTVFPYGQLAARSGHRINRCRLPAISINGAIHSVSGCDREK